MCGDFKKYPHATHMVWGCWVKGLGHIGISIYPNTGEPDGQET